jgi:hypothetical protein
MNMTFKMYLILDDTPGYPIEELINVDPDVEVVFLLPNIIYLLQPLDQGVLKYFSS